MGREPGLEHALQASFAEGGTRALHQSFPSSHLGEGCRLLTGEGTFESCGGSQFAAVV